MLSARFKRASFFLFHLPSVLRVEQFFEGVVGFLSLYLFYLCVYGVVVGGCLYIAYHTEGYWEAMLIVHHGQLELKGVVFGMGIVHKNIVESDAIFTYLHYLQWWSDSSVI